MDNADSPPMLLQLVSFGYRYGVPSNADLVFDVRFLPNPYYVNELKNLTGLDPDLQRYVLEKEESRSFILHLDQMLEFLLPCFDREGKSNLTLAIGCTGGRHRSVSLVEEFARRLQGEQRRVQILHRDIEK
jgi:UPF0042 nucleotide-binding protein